MFKNCYFNKVLLTDRSQCVKDRLRFGGLSHLDVRLDAIKRDDGLDIELQDCPPEVDHGVGEGGLGQDVPPLLLVALQEWRTGNHTEQRGGEKQR